MRLTTSRSKQGVLASLCVTAFVLLSAKYVTAQRFEPYSVNGDGYEIKMKRAIAYISNDNRSAMSVNYTYRFSGRTTVYITAIGLVPAKGEFTYFTYAPQIEFKEAENGAVITTLPVRETLIPMGAPAVVLAPAADFPTSFRPGQWMGSGSFQENLARVLDKYFRSGHETSSDAGVNYWTTTPRYLTEGVPSNMRCQVSIRVSFPFDPASNSFNFRVQFKGMEKLSHDDWGELTTATRGAVESFIDRVVEELKRGS